MPAAVVAPEGQQGASSSSVKSSCVRLKLCHRWPFKLQWRLIEQLAAFVKVQRRRGGSGPKAERTENQKPGGDDHAAEGPSP